MFVMVVTSAPLLFLLPVCGGEAAGRAGAVPAGRHAVPHVAGVADGAAPVLPLDRED